MSGFVKLALACAAGFIITTGACVKTKIYDCKSESSSVTVQTKR